jgi:lysophospholipase L1-like esterase
MQARRAMNRNFLYSTILFVFSFVVAIAFAEIALRIKNASMTNYDIEMWRYAKELKQPSPDPVRGHEHLKNASAVLQSVNMRTNDWGLRGGALAPRKAGTRRILVLGDSITLGWGVQEEDVLTSRLQKMFDPDGRKVEVLNAGVGNYNAERYIDWFFSDLYRLEPTDIVVHYFLRGAETLDSGGGNILLRNSELAVMVWIAANRVLNQTGERSLLEHYKEVYAPDQPGWIKAQESLKKLADYAKAHHIRLYLAMMPDIHNLKNYQFGFIHEAMQKVAAQDDYVFVDLLPAFGALSPEQIWAMPGDPHPNALGHKLMAEALFPVLQDANGHP